MSLADLGWDLLTVVEQQALAEPGRVARCDRGECTVLTPTPVRVATGHHEVTTGDWVSIGTPPAPGALPVLETVAPRRTAFLRAGTGSTTTGQVVAANVDVVLVTQSLEADPHEARLDRYLVLAWQSGAEPIVVLTKTDRRPAAEVARIVASLAGSAPVHAVSALTGDGIDALTQACLSPGRTVALIGLSGAGKSTLVNRIVGEEVMATAEVRSDGRGRHTTTHRQLIVLPGRGVLLDTPGMRALALWDGDEGIAQAFSDVDELMAQCRFSDCRHETEPGCAVRSVVAPERLLRWHKLQAELANQAIRRGERAALEERRRLYRVRARQARQRNP